MPRNGKPVPDLQRTQAELDEILCILRAFLLQGVAALPARETRPLRPAHR